MSAFHFTFIDGALGYDCVRCQARCCHGLGFALPAAELLPLVGRVPELAPFLQLRTGATHAFTLTDGCWALLDDGRCGVEVGHGYAAKPAACRLFPLQLRRIGGHAIVDLRLLDCPLEDARGVPDRPGATVMRHAKIAGELSALDLDTMWLEARLAPGTPDNWLARETAVLAETRVRLETGGVDTDVLPLVADGMKGGPGPLERLRDRWRAFLDVDSTPFDRAVARPFALALGPLRLAALTQSNAPPWPRLQRGLPARLVAGAFLAALSARAGRAPTLRGIAEVWRATPLVRDALARFDDRVDVADTPPPAGTPDALVAALAATVGQARTAPLGDALAHSGCPAPLRPLLLRLISERISPFLAPPGEGEGEGRGG